MRTRHALLRWITLGALWASLASCTVNPVPTPSSESPDKGGGGGQAGEDDRGGDPTMGSGGGSDSLAGALDAGSEFQNDISADDISAPLPADGTATHADGSATGADGISDDG